jgi:hypothetical protein
MTPLKQRGEVKWTNIYTKGEIRQTDTYIVHTIEKHDYTKTEGEDQTNTYIH